MNENKLLITLSDGQEIEIVNIDLRHDQVTWVRTDPEIYTGDCVTPVGMTTPENAIAEITAALEAELVQ
jgi:hypothetical protein